MIPVKLPEDLAWYRDLLRERLWPTADKIPEDWKAWSQTLRGIFASCDIPEPAVPEQATTLMEKIFLLRFEALNRLREQLDEKIPENSEQAVQLKGISTALLAKYSQFSRKAINTAIIDKIGQHVCPYCNENYIKNRQLRRGPLPDAGRAHAAAQLDHFFPKKHINYGIFSLTLSNLVPSCPVCNHIKGTQELKVSPYMSGRKLDDVKFTWKSAKHEPIPSSIEDMLLILRARSPENQLAKDILEDMETLHLAKQIEGKSESHYLPHKREAFLLLREARLYTKSHRELLWKDFGELLGFSREQEMFRHMLGVFYSEEDAAGYPLGKLRLDIIQSAYTIL